MVDQLELIEEEEFNITDIGASDGADPNITVASSKHSKTPQLVIKDGESYSFSAISWIFSELESGVADIPQTAIRINLDNFSRSGSMIDLDTFRLGQHHGICSEIEEISAPSTNGSMLSSAQCWWAGKGVQIAVFQKDNLIITKMRQIAEDDIIPSPLQDISTIDITSLIQ